MLQETSGTKQQWGLNVAQFNAQPVSSDASLAAAAKCRNRLCNQKPRVVWRSSTGFGPKHLALSWGIVGGGGQNSWMEEHGLNVCHICPTVGKRRGAWLNHNISACSVTGKRCEVVIYWLDEVFDVIHRIQVMSSLKKKQKPELVVVVVSHTTCEKCYQSGDVFRQRQAISRYGTLHRTNWNFALKQLPHLLLAIFWPEWR